jgi:tetratricopeptide (TPR) repeat protein
MGIFSTFAGAKTFKQGRKHVIEGNLEKALVYFDDAVRQSKEQKSFYEYRTYYYLALAILHSQKDEIEQGKEAYSKFRQEMRSLGEEYDKTPGLGTSSRAHSTIEDIKSLIRKYLPILEKVEN